MTLDVALAIPASTPPLLKPDMRPTADVAALVRDPQPDLPLPIPASNGQSAAVTQSKLPATASSEAVKAVDPTERVLKPYGVAMLPEMKDLAEENARQAEEETKAAASEDAVETKETRALTQTDEPDERHQAEPVSKADTADVTQPPAEPMTEPEETPESSTV